MKFRNISIHQYLQALASDAPVPGGGGTSALAAALGAALGIMVAAIMQKKSKAGARSRLMSLSKQLQARLRSFEATIDRDAAVYQALMQTYRRTRKLKNRVRAKQLIDRALKTSFEIQQRFVFN